MPETEHKKYNPSFLARVILLPITALAYFLYLVYLKTLRFENANFEQFPENRSASRPALYVLWNSKCLSLIPCLTRSDIRYLTFFDLKHWILQKMTGMKDSKRLVFESPEKAVFQVARSLRRGQHVAMAGDGPYGPPGKLKSGAPTIAQRTGSTLITMKVAVEKSFRLSWRWDDFEIGWPFSKVKITAAEHVWKKGMTIEQFREEIERSLGKH